MALNYNGNIMGKMFIEQKGREFEIQIRQGNCLAVFVHVSKQNEGEYLHILYTFFADVQHLKNIIKHDEKPFQDKVKNIRLNMRYKECQTLIKYLPKCGYEVTCYYE